MSISLSNHEERINNLEHRGIEFVTIAGSRYINDAGTVTGSTISVPLSESWKNFDFLIISATTQNWDNNHGGPWGYPSSISILHVDTMKNYPNTAWGLHMDTNTSNSHAHEAVYIRMADDNTANVSVFTLSQTSNDYLGSIIGVRLKGLKIYYIFRYNIYSKIIRSIISSLDKIFTLLKLGFKGVN